MEELLKKTSSEQRKALLNKEISAQELVNAHYERIEKVDSTLGAYNSLCKEQALETAKNVDEKIAKGEPLPPLAGIPLALKDNINLKDTKTTASSKILENFVSPYDATVSTKLKENLIPILGKVNLDEFAMGSSTENSAFKITRNPWDTNKVPGGSSGGSAAAVAGYEATLALGSDTGGSIRLPASFCGIVGMKPTYGRVSRYGLIAFASSLDQIGPFARNVEDTALLLEAISGHDHHDSTSLDIPVPAFSKALNKDIKGSKVGVIKELLAEGVSPDVKNAVENAIKMYKELGAEIVEISLPLLEYSIGVYYILATAEASSNLARFDGVKYGHRTKDPKNLLEMYTKTRAEGFGDEVKRRIMLGTYALSAGYYDAYYKKAQQLRRLIKEDFDRAFEKVDILVSPTCPNTAFEIGSKIEDPLSMYLTDIGTISANLAGIPGMSLPCGYDSDGMPIGLQILAPALQEEKLFNMAYNFEQAAKDIQRQPNL
ncbi:MAG: Asp-tRNA(Asn)/Glu-tRNA(Gln) amidotransferase subunit GatA [Candidatus Gastranaerophilaceae bacterium]|jgi:aspartyl/glutamyl-tRNA(asn/gln) amidotransferase, A subunit|uniref:Glutamyl-tRNA(Gln) amidotransferase subunit A n=1 Tax=Candidatus Limenecus avicola TaxID=2840847 RepID=A0A9D1SR20_9CLOT|nr:Asp-tRNA(Asn)/Glu-tRNA(Gln) amidotransferase subunit GatA [Candidatus Limenecus avicola]